MANHKIASLKKQALSAERARKSLFKKGAIAGIASVSSNDASLRRAFSGAAPQKTRELLGLLSKEYMAASYRAQEHRQQIKSKILMAKAKKRKRSFGR